LKEYARIQKDIKTEELTLEDIGVHAKELTGEFKSCVILLLNAYPYLVLITKAFCMIV
jgi:hypothetical protein